MHPKTDGEIHLQILPLWHFDPTTDHGIQQQILEFKILLRATDGGIQQQILEFKILHLITDAGIQQQILYPPNGLSIAEYLRRFNCFYTYVLLVIGNVHWIFNLAPIIRLFGTFKMFYLMGWDGWMDGWDGMGRNIKSVL